ncbi:MAG: hypothetical protein P9X27_00605 [Candidatus Kaelpia aquatica]|nr:hypothetical protein [Candidatus Kaelpia aquatica]
MIRSFLVALMVLSVFITGCSTLSGRRNSKLSDFEKQLEVSALLKFDDIPVPSGFKFIATESFAFQTDEIRVGLLKYTGRVSPEEVVVFYKEQMPLYNWKPINFIEYERRILNFEKDEQSTVITIDGKGSSSSLVIAVSPRSESELFDR